MNKRELIEDMKDFSGAGFMNRKKFADYLGYKDAHNVDFLLNGLETVNKKYFINDLADSILARKSYKVD